MNQFSARAQQVIDLSRKEAGRLQHRYVGTEHLLLGLIKLGQGTAVTVLGKLGLDLDAIRREVETPVGESGPRPAVAKIPYTPRFKKSLALAGKEAKAMKHQFVGTEHLLLGLIRGRDGIAARTLVAHGADIERTRNAILREIGDRLTPAKLEDPTGARATKPVGKRERRPATPTLNAHGENLTAAAGIGDIVPVRGLENEVEQIIRILCRRDRNNPIVVCDSPVMGRTVIEGVAHRIAIGAVPNRLFYRQLFALDLNGLASPSGNTLPYPPRFMKICDEILGNGDILLFLENLDRTWDFNTPGGSWIPDRSGPLRNVIVRGQASCIAILPPATWEAGKVGDSSLARLLEPVPIEAPGFELAFSIVNAQVPVWADFHDVTYREDTVLSAVKLVRHHCAETSYPEQILDLLDEAGALARNRVDESRPAEIREIEAEINRLYREKLAAVSGRSFYHALTLKTREVERCYHLDLLFDEWRASEAGQAEVLPDDVEEASAKLISNSPGDSPQREDRPDP